MEGFTHSYTRHPSLTQMTPNTSWYNCQAPDKHATLQALVQATKQMHSTCRTQVAEPSKLRQSHNKLQAPATSQQPHIVSRQAHCRRSLQTPCCTRCAASRTARTKQAPGCCHRPDTPSQYMRRRNTAAQGNNLLCCSTNSEAEQCAL